MRTLVIGDIHGSYKGLVQALERAKYDPSSDRIITIGDVSDGWPETFQVVDFLLYGCNPEVDIHIIGNHDAWTREWMDFGNTQPIWTNQGGQATLDSYIEVAEREDVDVYRADHHQFFKNQRPYFVDDQFDFVFVHAGIPFVTRRIEDNIVDDRMWWDRGFWAHTMFHEEGTYTEHNKVFIGHTSIGDGPPMKRSEVWNLDTGAGWEGRITVMDMETEEYWQSDKSSTLYPNAKGRHG